METQLRLIKHFLSIKLIAIHSWAHRMDKWMNECRSFVWMWLCAHRTAAPGIGLWLRDVCYSMWWEVTVPEEKHERQNLHIRKDLMPAALASICLADCSSLPHLLWPVSHALPLSSSLVLDAYLQGTGWAASAATAFASWSANNWTCSRSHFILLQPLELIGIHWLIISHDIINVAPFWWRNLCNLGNWE